mmetsp:Transcript_43265/g.74690  ORF Transcript_43265/g.74690 Transcript_43265/m.74690 type:complete len:390 (+) Transcript_43265:105-1274(+)
MRRYQFLSESMTSHIGASCRSHLDCGGFKGLDCVENVCTCSVIMGYRVGEGYCEERSATTQFALFWCSWELVATIAIAYYTMSIIRAHVAKRNSGTSKTLKSVLKLTFVMQISQISLIFGHWISAAGIDPNEIFYQKSAAVFLPVMMLCMGTASFKVWVACTETAFRFMDMPWVKKRWSMTKKLQLFLILCLAACTPVLVSLNLLRWAGLSILLCMPVAIWGLGRVSIILKSQHEMNGKKEKYRSTNGKRYHLSRYNLDCVRAIRQRLFISFIVLAFGVIGCFRSVHSNGEAFWLFHLLVIVAFLLWQSSILLFAEQRNSGPKDALHSGSRTTHTTTTKTTSRGRATTEGVPRKVLPVICEEENGDGNRRSTDSTERASSETPSFSKIR